MKSSEEPSDSAFMIRKKSSLSKAYISCFSASDLWTPVHKGGLRTVEGVQLITTKFILGFSKFLACLKSMFEFGYILNILTKCEVQCITATLHL